MEELVYKKNESIKSLIKIPEILSKKEKITKDEMEKCDINYMKEIASMQMIMTSFFKTFYNYLPKEIQITCNERAHDLKAKSKRLLEILVIIKDEFEKNDIDFVLIKGFALSNYIYSDFDTRDFNDLDIIIDLEKFQKANELMKKMGFTNELSSKDIPDLTTMECYEIGYFYPFTGGGQLSVKLNQKLSIELKVATSSIKNMKLINQFKNNKISMSIENVEFNTFNLDDTFIMLCTNTYANFELEFAKARLRDYFDIYFFIEKYEKKLNWEYILGVTNKYKITHQLYAVFNVMNLFYKDRFSNEILDFFKLEKIPYDKSIFHNYEHGWMRDWNTSFIDLMLNRTVHRAEMYYQHSIKAYSSRNKYFNNKIYLHSLDDVHNNFSSNEKLKGFKSSKNELEYSYRFNHDKDNIYFELTFEKYNHANNMRAALIIFDIDREFPRKMIEFSYFNEKIISKSLFDNFECNQIRNSEHEILISIPKNEIKVLRNKGKVLSYRMYSLRKYDNSVDFAIIDDLNIFDFDNPHVLYLNSNTQNGLY